MLALVGMALTAGRTASAGPLGWVSSSRQASEAAAPLLREAQRGPGPRLLMGTFTQPLGAGAASSAALPCMAWPGRGEVGPEDTCDRHLALGSGSPDGPPFLPPAEAPFLGL